MKKKRFCLFVLLGFIAFFLTNIQDTIEVHAEPESYTEKELLLNDDMAYVMTSYTVENQTVKWSIQYEKHKSKAKQQLKISINEQEGLDTPNSLSKLNKINEWLVLSDYEDALSGEFFFETSLKHGKADEDYALTISIQRDLKMDEEETSTHENVLNDVKQKIIIDKKYVMPEENTTQSTLNTTTTDENEKPTQDSDSEVQETDDENQNIISVSGLEAIGVEDVVTSYNPLIPEYIEDSTGKYPIDPIPYGKTVLNPIGGNSTMDDKKNGWSTDIEGQWINYFAKDSEREDSDFSIRKYARETNTQGLFDVFLEVKGNVIDSSTAQPVDIVLVADRSWSMTQDNRWTNLKNGVQSFMETIHDNGLDDVIHMGYVSFADSSSTSGGDIGTKSIEIGKLDNTQKNAINNELSKRSGNYTNTFSGLYEAQRLILNRKNAGVRPNTKTVVVLLTDGVPTRHYKITSAEQNTDLPDGIYSDGYNLSNLIQGTNQDGSINSPYTVDGLQIKNHFVAPISIAKDLKENLNVEIRVIGIQLEGRGTFDTNQITARMQAIASSRSSGTDVDHYYYTNVQVASEIVTELQNVAYSLTKTVVNGQIIDPMGDLILLSNDFEPYIETYPESINEDIATKPVVNIDSRNRLVISNIHLGTEESIKLHYQVHIDTESENFKSDTWMLANGITTFSPNVETENIVEFAVPALKAPGVVLSINKIWLNDIANQRPEKLTFSVYRSTSTKKDTEKYGTVILAKETEHVWKDTFTQSAEGLPFAKFDNSGEDFIYTLIEESLPNYQELLQNGIGKTEGNEISYEFINQAKYGFVIRKISTVNNELLSKAVFSISGEFANGKKDSVVLIESDNGHYILPEGYYLAEDSQYILTEEKSPSGHKSSGPWIVQVIDRQVTIENKSNDDTETLSVTDENSIIYDLQNDFEFLTLDILKVNANNHNYLLEGVTFQLTNDDGYNEKIESDKNGVVSFTQLIPGNYTLEEVETIEGYEINEDKWKFTITLDGDILFDKDDFTLSDDGLTLEKIVENELKAFELEVNKVNELGDSLEGAMFSLTNLNTAEDVEVIADKNKFKFSNLQPGKYELKEIETPENFIPMKETIKIQIKDNGEVQVSDLAQNIVVNLSLSGNNIISFNVENIQMAPLPSTGGLGIWAYLMVGGLMIGGVFFKRLNVLDREERLK